jgi:hypothetical protein
MFLQMLIGLLLLSLFLPCRAYAQYGPSEPVFGVPFFHIKGGKTHCAGRAFAIQWFHDRKILLMPLHLLGPGGSYPEYILPQNVPDVIESVDVYSLNGDRVLTVAKPGLLRTGVPVEKARGDLGEDLMAFELPTNCRLTLFPLYPTLVTVGTKVWILSKKDHPSNSEPDRFSGTIARSSATGVTVVMDRPLTAMSSSGAPIVNAKNELVAMMVGKQDPERRMIIMGIASTRLYSKLYRELSH